MQLGCSKLPLSQTKALVNERQFGFVAFSFSFWYVWSLFCLFLFLLSLWTLPVSLGTRLPDVISLSKVYRLQPRTVLVGFLFKIWKITQSPKGKWKSKNNLSMGECSALRKSCCLPALWSCYGNSQKPKNKAINDFNRSMRKSFFPNEGCCLNPGRSNLNWTKEQTKDLETCGRTNTWLRRVWWFKLTTLNLKFFGNYLIWLASEHYEQSPEQPKLLQI